MFFNSNFFEHLRYFTAAARRRGATGNFALGSMDANVRVGDREVQFRAQFLTIRPDGSTTYSMEFDESSPGFVGWLPYFNKRWPEATDKLVFKRRVAQAGLPTPLASTGSVLPELGDFLVKKAKGSLGQGMRGPYAKALAATTPVGEEEFAERFFLGQIGKAWYWDDRVITVELRDPPTVEGDGLASIGELVRRGSRRANVDEDTDFSKYRGFRWADVPARGAKIIVDFRYGSLCYPFKYISLNRYDELRDGPVLTQLNQWGPLFWSFVPEPIRAGTIYSVDFVIARDGGIRLLEMNCNPTVPPEAYETMFCALFGEPMTATTPGQPAAQAAQAGMIQPLPLPVPPPSIPLQTPEASSSDSSGPTADRRLH